MNIKTIGKKIITFYSYKGGVGRTQLLANLAAFFCFYRNKRILVLDWDLEAPGLHFYFGIEKEQIQKGTIDLFQSYVDMVRSSEKGLNESEMPYFDESYILPTHYRTEKGGSIDLISAGKQDENFSNKVNDFGWQHFYKNLDGAAYIEVLKTKLKELDYDYIFVDSRTGINDYSGICNIQFPDINVIIAAPNYQNLNGSLDICKKITESPYMKLEINGIPIRKPLIYPILSRLDLSEDTNSSEWILRFSREFDSHIQKTFKLQSLKLSSKEFVEKTNIYYVKELSYKETIVFKEEDQEENFSGIKDQFQQLSKFLLDERAITQTKNQQEKSQNQQIDSSKPKSEAEAYLNMGNSFYFLGKYEEAESQYLQAIEIEEENYEVWSNLGLTYCNLKDYEESINCFKKAIEIKKDSYEVWNNLANTYYEMRNYEQAIEYYKQSIEIKSDFYLSWYNLGHVYDDFKNYEEAIKCNKKAIEIKNNYPEAWYNLGNIYHKLSNYEKAINCYKKVIEINPNDYKAWDNLGVTYSKLKNHEEAINCYNKALEINPNNENILYNLACFYAFQNQKEKSLSYLEKAISLNPKTYKSMAKQDEAFKNLWQDKDFLALVGE